MLATYTKQTQLCHLDIPLARNTYRTSAAGDERVNVRINLSKRGGVGLQYVPRINQTN
jgi:hypothetical protein